MLEVFKNVFTPSAFPVSSAAIRKELKSSAKQTK